MGENKRSSSLGLVLLLLILVSFSSGRHLDILIRRGHRHSGQRPSRSTGYLPSRGRARWVGGRRWRLSRRRQSPKRASFFISPLKSFLEKQCSFFFEYGFVLLDTAGYASS